MSTQKGHLLTHPHAAAALATDLQQFKAQLVAWLGDNDAQMRPLLASNTEFDLEVASSRELRKTLWQAGWGRYGWPEELGGLGGTSLHRAVLYEELYRQGWAGPNIFEHIEIIAPTLARFAEPSLLESLLPSFLDGSEAWAQGFSEPDAGSDLASLRTRADIEGDEFVVNGAKIWTSWAKWARWCLALVRTGTPEDRHRGLTMMIIDLSQLGVEVAPIRQANGTDELAQVFFDDVRVPRSHLVGEIGGGWDVAMFLLARERGTLSWMRHLSFRERLLAESSSFTEGDDRQVGDFVARWAGVRAAAIELLRRDGRGESLGPESAFNKLLMTRTEQDLYNLVHDTTGSRIGIPLTAADELIQRDYLFSRIVTVYGGSQEMQLMTIARHVIGLNRG